MVGYYTQLRDREFEGRTVGREWYKWHRPRKPRLLLSRPKIVVRRQFRDEVAAVDPFGALPLDSCWALVPRLKDDAWIGFCSRIGGLIDGEPEETRLLSVLASMIAQKLRAQLARSDTPLQGSYLAVRSKDLRSLAVDAGKVADSLSD